MTVFSNNIKRLFKRKGLIFILLMPIVFTSFFLLNSSGVSYNVGIIDLDHTTASEWLLQDLINDSSYEYLDEMSYEKIKENILLGDYDFLVLIPKNYEQSLIEGGNIEVEFFYSENSQVAEIPRSSLASKVELINKISVLALDKNDMYQLLNRSSEGVVVVESRILGETDRAVRNTAGGMGILVMSMILFSHSSGGKMNDDRANGIYQRVMASPMSRRRYTMELMASLFVMVCFNIIAVMLVLSGLLGGDFGPNPQNVFLVLMTFGIVAVAITTLINNVSKDRQQASAISVMVTTPLCMLGGCFWPIEVTPKVMQYISNFVPTKWVMDAVYKTISGGGLDTVVNELAILLLFAFAIFAVSSSKRIAWSK